jgi:hypothetical protein
MHAWAGTVWTLACVLGWIANRIFVATDSHVGSGFGNLPYEILCGLVGVGVAVTGLILAVFRPTRQLGSLVGAAGAGFVAGLILGFAMAMVSRS